MFVRLWLFTWRGNSYPEGGTYDTSVINDQTGDCSDPQQFDRFQNMLQYANDRGEHLMEVGSPEEAYAYCSGNRFNPTSAQCQSSYVNNESTMQAAITRPAPNSCGAYTGGGSRTTPAPACSPVPSIVEPSTMNTPMVITQTDNARRIIQLARLNRIVPTINF